MAGQRFQGLAYAAILALGYILLGCGASLTISLPNNHAVIVASSSDIVIVSGNGGAVVKWSVGDLADSGDFVFGTIVDPDTRLFQEYFVLDTRTSVVEYYPDRQSWAAALSDVGITDLRVRGPSAFYNWTGEVWRRSALLIVISLLILLFAAIWRYRSRRA